MLLYYHRTASDCGILSSGSSPGAVNFLCTNNTKKNVDTVQESVYNNNNKMIRAMKPLLTQDFCVAEAFCFETFCSNYL